MRLFSSALKAGVADADRTIARLIEDAARILDLHSGKTTGATLVATAGRTFEDGASEIVWTHALLPLGEEGNRRMHAAEISRTTTPWRGRIELFFGETEDRLERIAVIEDTTLSGAWRGRLPQPDGWVAVSAGTGGTTVLGPARPVHFGKNLLPAADEMFGKILPAPIWRKRGAGPGGEAIESVLAIRQIFSGGNSVGEFVAGIGDAPGKDLTLSGWVKHGQITFAVLGEDGQPRDIGSQAMSGPQGDWEYFEMELSAAMFAKHQEAAHGKLKGVAVRLSPGGAYSGLRVIATEPKPPAKK